MQLGYLLISTPPAENIFISSLILRLFIGILFVMHGLPKLRNPSRVQMRRFMAQLGIAGPLFDAVAILEVFGGAFLIVGFLTRLVSALFTLFMVGTITLYMTKMNKPPIKKGYVGGWELDTVLLAGSLAILLLGSGIISVDYPLGLTQTLIG